MTWRTNGEYDRFYVAVSEDDEPPLSREEIERSQSELSKLALPAVLDSLRKAYADCSPKNGEIPGPRAVQAFLAIWKVLWRWKQNARHVPPPKAHEIKDESPR